MEAIVLHLKLVRKVWGVPLAYVVRQHTKVIFILLRYDAFMNADEEIIDRAPIVDTRSNLKQPHDWLDMRYINSQCNAFKNLTIHLFITISQRFSWI